MSKGKLTPKQERFCLAYIENGGNASAAYRAAGYSDRQTQKAITENASKLLTKVSPRIEELQAQHAKRHAITIDSLVAELEEARCIAMCNPRGISAAVSAVMGKAKLLGLVTDKHELTGKDSEPIEVNTSTNELVSRISRLAARSGANGCTRRDH